jgi:hypothetical protein
VPAKLLKGSQGYELSSVVCFHFFIQKDGSLVLKGLAWFIERIRLSCAFQRDDHVFLVRSKTYMRGFAEPKRDPLAHAIDCRAVTLGIVGEVQAVVPKVGLRRK